MATHPSNKPAPRIDERDGLWVEVTLRMGEYGQDIHLRMVIDKQDFLDHVYAPPRPPEFDFATSAYYAEQMKKRSRYLEMFSHSLTNKLLGGVERLLPDDYGERQRKRIY